MNAEIFIPITLFICLAIVIAAVAYYRTRENLAMIERGMNPKIQTIPRSPYRYHKWALLFVGAGIGLLLAYLIDLYVISKVDSEPVAIYFSLIAIGGGLGLLTAHKAEKQWIEAQPKSQFVD